LVGAEHGLDGTSEFEVRSAVLGAGYLNPLR